jgi:hypothetical protein
MAGPRGWKPSANAGLGRPHATLNATGHDLVREVMGQQLPGMDE